MSRNKFHLRYISRAALFLGISLFAVAAHRVGFAEIKLTDDDGKEIIVLLFKQELGTLGQGQEIVILLSPGMDSTWIPTLPGVRFRRIEYSEEKQVSEYYEIWFEPHRNYVEVRFSKGNACKKAGYRYSLRKSNGVWKAERFGAIESLGGGSACPACKIDSGAIYTHQKKPTATPSPTPKILVLTGKVLAIRCKQGDSNYIRCDVDLSLDFTNNGNEPLIILQPHADYSFWYGGASVALSQADTEKFQYVYQSYAWPSVYKFPMYQQLAQRLDQQSPPPTVTRVLQPQESWNWKHSAYLSFNEENTCNYSIGVEIGWREIKQSTAPLWLQVSYEMWPFNVENFKPGLGGKLQKRWKKYGRLFLDEKSDRHWFAHLTSEPIELDFRPAQLQVAAASRPQ